ncbi:hypothetical protein CCH79_00018461 [Gambusia affinis]|uniref:Terminal nucleotidyltransferase 5C n=1 Tax=Gambusia affinis TaxID=33528 RepID=A0A315UXY8_GAMAF|nr:hypothetical protein CCH79_00018461 [Gambusia affinis]
MAFFGSEGAYSSMFGLVPENKFLTLHENQPSGLTLRSKLVKHSNGGSARPKPPFGDNFSYAKLCASLMCPQKMLYPFWNESQARAVNFSRRLCAVSASASCSSLVLAFSSARADWVLFYNLLALDDLFDPPANSRLFLHLSKFEACVRMENKEESSCSSVSDLTWEQVSRLNDVLTEVVPVHGRGNFPTLEVQLKDIVARVRSHLELSGIRVKDIRLNGSTASHVLVQDIGWSYKDLDFIFRVDLPTEAEFRLVKDVVLGILLDFLPEGVNKEKITPMTLKEAYVQKLVKVNTEQDRWSLISLSNNNGRNVELKFVDSIRRQFEFSVDSFQIVLDSVLSHYEQQPPAAAAMSEQFHPAVRGESVYGDFNAALGHLRNKLIATKRPEEIRGGGLLKYCNLLVRDFRPANQEEFKALERYMCSRFFIDFPDIGEQQRKVEAYLMSHFIGEEKSKYDYLQILRKVVNESTVCLMGHERRQTLHLLSLMAFRVLAEQSAIPDASCVTCYYQPAPYIRDHNFSNYYVANQNIPTWLPCN